MPDNTWFGNRDMRTEERYPEAVRSEVLFLQGVPKMVRDGGLA